MGKPALCFMMEEKTLMLYVVSEDLDQTTNAFAQSDLGLHCLLTESMNTLCRQRKS